MESRKGVAGSQARNVELRRPEPRISSLCSFIGVGGFISVKCLNWVFLVHRFLLIGHMYRNPPAHLRPTSKLLNATPLYTPLYPPVPLCTLSASHSAQ